MADPKVLISELTQDPAPTLADSYWPVTRGGVSRKWTGTQISTLVKSDIAAASAATSDTDAFIIVKNGGLERLEVAFTPNVSASSRFGMKNGGGMFLHEDHSTEPSIKTGMALRTQTDVAFTGGVPGNVLSGHWNLMNVGPDVTDFCWTGLDQLINNATDGENVGRYSHVTKKSSGSTWSSVFQLNDETDVALGGATVAVEVDILANGSNNIANRVGIDLVFGKRVDGDPVAGIGHAIRINPRSDEATISNGLQINGTVMSGVTLSNDGTYGLQFTAESSLSIGVDFSGATFMSAPIRMAADQKIQLTANGANTFGFETTGGKVTLKNNAIERVAINMGNGAISIAGNVILGGRHSALPADATDLASVIALANALKAGLSASSGTNKLFA